jgi:hypothetical protein
MVAAMVLVVVVRDDAATTTRVPRRVLFNKRARARALARLRRARSLAVHACLVALGLVVRGARWGVRRFGVSVIEKAGLLETGFGEATPIGGCQVGGPAALVSCVEQ